MNIPKLSDAIMMNGMTKPQGFGGPSVGSLDAPCAIGGALQVIGAQVLGKNSLVGVDNFEAFRRAWPWTSTQSPVDCPACIAHLKEVRNVIWHLNDTHRWTRTQIAEWVATVEPQEIPSTPPSPNYQGVETGACLGKTQAPEFKG